MTSNKLTSQTTRLTVNPYFKSQLFLHALIAFNLKFKSRLAVILLD